MERWSTTLSSLKVGVVDTACGRVEAARAGAGPAVLLVHGIPGSWRQAVPLAEDLVPGFQVLLPSRPGYGSTPIGAGRTYEDQADTYAAVLDAFEIDRCAIVGISGGGPSALTFALRHRLRTNGLVLACALSPHLMDRPSAWSPLRVPGLVEALTPALRTLARRKLRRPGAVDAEMRRSLTPDEFARAEADPSIRSDLVRHVLGHQEAPAGLAGLRNDLAQLRCSPSTVPSLTEITCPVLISHGDADDVVAVDHARFHAAAISGARLHVYEQAGHLYLFTRRREAVTEIRKFVDSVS